MNEADNQTIADIKSKLQDESVDRPQELPFTLFEKPNNKTTQLLASFHDRSPIDGKRRWYDFKFKESCFVTSVSIAVQGYSSYHVFEFSWRDEADKEYTVSGKGDNGVFVFEVNDLCKKISFRPPIAWLSSTEITSVSVEGIKREDISSLLEDMSDIQSYKEKALGVIDAAIAKAEVKIQDSIKAALLKESLSKEISNLRSQQTKWKNIVDDLSAKRNELITQNAAAEDSLESSTQRLKSSNSEVSLANAKLASLNVGISEAQTQLRELKGNVNLFPTEIVSFVNQGSKNIWQYFWLAIIPILLLPAVFVSLIFGAADLSTIFTRNPDLNINAVVLSRMPYVAISLAIITASYKIARAFILEIVKINNQRLSLTKISIIAKDVSSAAEKGLKLSDEDLYRLRTDFKNATPSRLYEGVHF